MVKHSELPASRNNERRAVISFDVSQVPVRNVSEGASGARSRAKRVWFFRSRAGFEFALYGITDEALDAWDEKKMTWGATPACTDEGVTPGQARKLAEFWIPRGGLRWSVDRAWRCLGRVRSPGYERGGDFS
jgi:hypothetical protein